MSSDLTRGAYSGKETFLSYDSAGSWETPTWKIVVRARNVTVNNGPALADVEFHGSANTSQIPGYKAFNGSFEYVRRRGTDTVYDALKAAADAGNIIHLQQLNGPNDVAESVGWKAPCLLGEFAETANGGDPVVVTIPFGLADAYDSSDNEIGVTPATGVDPGP